MERHRVYCEVTPQEVVFQHGAETHLGLARFGIVLLAAESCDLDNNIGIKETYRPKTLTDKDNRIRMRWRDDLLDFVWLGIGCHVRVVGLLAMQQHIAYRPSYNIELFVLRVKSFRQRDDNILHDEQYILVSIVLVQCDYCIMFDQDKEEESAHPRDTCAWFANYPGTSWAGWCIIAFLGISKGPDLESIIHHATTVSETHDKR